MDIAFAVGVGAYGASAASYLATHWRPSDRLQRMAHGLLGAALVFWAGLLGWMAHEGAGQLTIWLSVSAWALCGLYLLLLRRYPIGALGSFITALATALAHLALMVSQPAAPSEIGWLLAVHIALALLGITAFAFATGASVLYLLQSRALKQKDKTSLNGRLPPLFVLDRLALRSILVGFPIYTVAILIGGAYAVQQGGGIKLSYVLAMVSWLIYGIVLQARLTAGWRGRKAAILTAVGLCAALIVVTQYSLGVA
jgi:ABC-type uncharacterized transport system permease subunit